MRDRVRWMRELGLRVGAEVAMGGLEFSEVEGVGS